MCCHLCPATIIVTRTITSCRHQLRLPPRHRLPLPPRHQLPLPPRQVNLSSAVYVCAVCLLCCTDIMTVLTTAALHVRVLHTKAVHTDAVYRKLGTADKILMLCCYRPYICRVAQAPTAAPTKAPTAAPTKSPTAAPTKAGVSNLDRAACTVSILCCTDIMKMLTVAALPVRAEGIRAHGSFLP